MLQNIKPLLCIFFENRRNCKNLSSGIAFLGIISWKSDLEKRLLKTIQRRSSNIQKKVPSEQHLPSQSRNEKFIFHSLSTKASFEDLEDPRYDTRKKVNFHPAMSNTKLLSQKIVPSEVQCSKTMVFSGLD